MLIRLEQMENFRLESEQAFAAKATARLHGLFPKHTAFMGAAAVSAVVRLGIIRAREFRFKSERGIQTYLSLMVYFGSEFHRDPQYHWMRELLEDASPDDENTRIDRVITATGDYLAPIAGPNREHVDEALSKLLGRGRTLVTYPPQPVTLEAVRLLLTQIYPEKATYLAESGLNALIQSAHAGARRHELMGTEPVIFFSLLMLLLGSFADEDPQFPWIGGLLSKSEGNSEKPSFHNLVNQSFEHLAAWTAC
jgi:hypothetical protein